MQLELSGVLLQVARLRILRRALQARTQSNLKRKLILRQKPTMMIWTCSVMRKKMK
jgi:hypothetical protein